LSFFDDNRFCPVSPQKIENFLTEKEEITTESNEMTATMSVMTTMEKQMQKWLEGEVGRLATQYKFNKKEAMSYLRGEIERVAPTEKKAPKAATETKTKTVKSVEKADLPQPDLPLPYCGAGADDQCCAVVLNHQMFTQCTHRVSGDFTTEGEDGAITLKLCKGCFKSAGTRTKSGNKALLYGAIAERLEKGGVIGNNGALRKPVPYANVMAKLGITEQQAVLAAEKVGVTIPEEEIRPAPVQRGRPKKTKAVEVVADTSDSGSGSDKSAAKKRGRPKKEKKVLSAAQGDDLIASLVQEAQEAPSATDSSSAADNSSADGSSSEGEGAPPKKKAKKEVVDAGAAKKDAAAAKKAEKEVAAAAKKAEKAEAARVKKAEAEEVKLARVAALVLKKEAAAAVKAAAKVGKAVAAEEKKALAATKKAATAAKKAPHAAPPPAHDVAELEVEAEDGEQQEEEEEETQVVKWECPADSKTYLKASDNVLYDAESHDAVGVWNEKENKIDELPAEDDEE